jgi:hypothetical protein
MERITSNPFNLIFATDVTPIEAFVPAKSFSVTRMTRGEDAGATPTESISFDPPYFVESGKRYGMREIEGQTQIWEIANLDEPGEFRWAAEAKRAA